MTDEDEASLLWLLARPGSSEDGLNLSGEDLESYRRGTLPEERARELEAALAASPRARQALAELARVELPAPSPELRGRVLASLEPARPQPLLRPRARNRWYLPVAVAAALLLAAGMAWRLAPGRSHLAGELPPLTATVSGLAESRASAPGSTAARALPQTRLTIEVSAGGDARADLVYGLYRLDQGRLVTCTGDPRVTTSLSREGARFTARAGDLLGSQPGPYRLFVVVRASDALPPVIPLAGTEPALPSARILPLTVDMLEAQP
ncbi:MAG: hypothetical protein U0002_04370 [Thermoanaerobaculia bacterium]